MLTLLNKRLVTFFIPLIALAAHGAEPSQVQIKRFRFAQHNQLGFERLVLEFASRGATANPAIRLVPTSSGKETVIAINRVALTGAIPEASINDSYTRRSRFFGPIAINNDNPTEGFNLRTFVKDPQAMVDAFWLQNPSRLIIDVYPRTSPRAQGPDVMHASRGVASTGKGFGKRNVVCFYAKSQVAVNLGFERGSTPRGLNMVVDDAQATYVEDNNVVCYPSSAQVQPKISFEMKNKAPRATLGLAPQAFSFEPAPVAAFTPPVEEQKAAPWNTGKVVEKEEELNKAADLALSVSDEELEGRGLASPGFFSDMDNFDKNNPPPSLGKALPSGKTPQLASPTPFGLLPPTE